MDETKARILHLQRLSTEDGPGIRTTVFFKGCSLRCSWCHNPESLTSNIQLQHLASSCIGCGTCLESCPQDCLSQENGGIAIDREKCDLCGLCVKACPSGALELLGLDITLDDLYHELLKDTSYYDKSGGGVTLSGGEPALQADFCAALLEKLQAAGIHTALDTCGMTSGGNLEKILPHVDLVMYDLKEIDPARHELFTGQNNQRILENLLLVRSSFNGPGGARQIWVRTPLIPGRTAQRENLEGIGAFLAEHLADSVARWELCAFNNLCQDKYDRLGLDWEFAGVPLLSADEVAELESWAKGSGFDPSRVLATGATRVAD